MRNGEKDKRRSKPSLHTMTCKRARPADLGGVQKRIEASGAVREVRDDHRLARLVRMVRPGTVHLERTNTQSANVCRSVMGSIC